MSVGFVQTAQEHLAQLAKLKSAKDEADAKHLLLQKQHEADKERLKTELTFKVRNVYALGGLIKRSLAPRDRDFVAETLCTSFTQEQRFTNSRALALSEAEIGPMEFRWPFSACARNPSSPPLWCHIRL